MLSMHIATGNIVHNWSYLLEAIYTTGLFIKPNIFSQVENIMQNVLYTKSGGGGDTRSRKQQIGSLRTKDKLRRAASNHQGIKMSFLRLYLLLTLKCTSCWNM